MEVDCPAVTELMAEVAAAVALRGAGVCQDIRETILREIPELRDDKPVLALHACHVRSNVETCLQMMQHQIDLAAARARPRRWSMRAGWPSAVHR